MTFTDRILRTKHIHGRGNKAKILGIYYILTAWMKKYRLDTPSCGDSPLLIVSLTSFPLRLNTLWLVIESIMRQKHKPDKLILWLNAEEMKGVKIPNRLLRQQKRGLTIEFVGKQNLRSHEKYLYAMQAYPQDMILTVDDDHILGSKTISYLMDAHKKFPIAICCNKSNVVSFDGETIMPYAQWRQTLIPLNLPSLGISAVGYGGVLYPPGAVNAAVFDTETILRYALPTDDLWLKACSVLNGTKVVRTDNNILMLPLKIKNNVNLYDTNVNQNENDKYLNLIREYFLHTHGRDLFYELKGVAAKDAMENKNTKMLKV